MTEYVAWRQNVWISDHQSALNAARNAFVKFQAKQPKETEEEYQKRIQNALNAFHHKRGWCMDPFSCFDKHPKCEDLRHAAYGSTEATKTQTNAFRQQMQEKKNIV